MFPAYKLSDFEGPEAVPIVELLQAVQLLETAQKIRNASSGS